MTPNELGNISNQQAGYAMLLFFFPQCAKISPNDKRSKSKLQAWNNKDLLEKAAYKVD